MSGNILPYYRIPDDAKRALDILELRDVLQEVLDIPVLIGFMGSIPFDGAPPYISFANGQINPEGAVVEFCGADIDDSTVCMATLLGIIQHAESMGAKFLFLRTGLTVAREESRYDDFDSPGNFKYFPARVQAYARVAFLTKLQGE